MQILREPNFLAIQITFLQSVTFVLILILLFLGFKYLETFWSYKISKPFSWEAAIKRNQISKELLKTERFYRDKARLYNFWFQVEQLKKNKVNGAFAEIGVHKGETAKAIHHMDQDRTFYLFDSFEGFRPEDLALEKQTDNRFTKEMFSDTSVNKVKQYIKGNKKLIFKPGYFPESSIGLDSETFALVHIDADLYAPTIEALKYFYPKLNNGGVIIIHDYNHNWEGVPKAIHEFIGTIPESLIELSDWQGSVMIIKNS